jgi:hypothetical protein
MSSLSSSLLLLLLLLLLVGESVYQKLSWLKYGDSFGTGGRGMSAFGRDYTAE